ncbi:MAG: hypothetical protein CUN57_00605 [Phototrophicales bacterium]|nr:MAG: hypothetical protein CUN57_00605 [Phototrophicales bacterium]
MCILSFWIDPALFQRFDHNIVPLTEHLHLLTLHSQKVHFMRSLGDFLSPLLTLLELEYISLRGNGDWTALPMSVARQPVTTQVSYLVYRDMRHTGAAVLMVASFVLATCGVLVVTWRLHLPTPQFLGGINI